MSAPCPFFSQAASGDAVGSFENVSGGFQHRETSLRTPFVVDEQDRLEPSRARAALR
jgi:hypothetical protein